MRERLTAVQTYSPIHQSIEILVNVSLEVRTKSQSKIKKIIVSLQFQVGICLNLEDTSYEVHTTMVKG